jgi:hypothetical protein
MNFAWATLLILVLLLPGFFFLFGFVARERLPRDFVWTAPYVPIILALAFSIVVHGIYYVTIDYLFKAFNWPTIDIHQILVALGAEQGTDQSTVLLALSISHHRLLIFTYIILSMISGVITGRKFSGWVLGGNESRSWKYIARSFLPKHGWISDLVRDHPKKSITLAYILTSTQFDHKILMYQGTVKDFFANSDGTLSHIVLENAQRFYMDLSDDAVSISNIKDRQSIESERNDRSDSTSSLCHNLFIEGRNILNIVFEKIVLPDTGKPQKDIETLDKLATMILSQFKDDGSQTG